MKRYDNALVWFRRDLRAEDNAALSRALAEAARVHCVFVFDTEILDALERKADRRVEFIWHSVKELQTALRKLGGDLHVLHGNARSEIPNFVRTLEIEAVYANRDYEPSALSRDEEVARCLGEDKRQLHLCKDQVIFERSEILNAQDRPYVVFTPYKRAWLARLSPDDAAPYPVSTLAGSFSPEPATEVPELEHMGFTPTNLKQLGVGTGSSGAGKLLVDFMKRAHAYAERRDYPALAGTSHLSVHLRFGTISIRQLVRAALELDADTGARDGASVWLSELIWREFYFSILFHFPHVETGAFRREYDALEFDNDADKFRSWCDAATGYPLVDAAMRQINSTGYMHNRLRMLSASFLVKDLHVDWRWGEEYFARNLNDFDLAANNGGWQWCASTGCDAQPYFRIFNPVTQSRKFDPEGRFIRMQLPELAEVPDKYIHEPWKMPEEVQRASNCVIGQTYPPPVVDHSAARKKSLARYAAISAAGKP